MQCVTLSWQHGERKKATRFRKKEKNVPNLFGGLGEVVEQPASYCWRRKIETKLHKAVRSCTQVGVTACVCVCMCVLENADWENAGFFKSSQSHESMR